MYFLEKQFFVSFYFNRTLTFSPHQQATWPSTNLQNDDIIDIIRIPYAQFFSKIGNSHYADFGHD